MTTDDTRHTLGRAFRTPAHPQVLAALGRALYSFLSIEESVAAILYEAGDCTLPKARAKMAGAKKQALTQLASKYRTSAAGGAVADSLDKAAHSFGVVKDAIPTSCSTPSPIPRERMPTATTCQVSPTQRRTASHGR